MSAIQGTILASKISPGDTNATFPTHIDIYGQGGLMCVSNTDGLTSIPFDRQKLGMIIYNAQTNQYHKLSSLGSPFISLSNLTNALPFVGLSGGTIDGALTVTDSISTKLITLSSSYSSSTGIRFAPNYNLYLTPEALRLDNNFQILGQLRLGYDGVTNNDGANIYMDYSNGGDFGQLYITTRDNGSEPIVFQQREDFADPSSYYEPLVIGSDHHVGINVPLSDTRTFEKELTVFGDISASGTLHGKAQDSTLDAASTNTVMNSAITSALLLLSPAPTYTAPTASLTFFSPSVFEVGEPVSQSLTLDWTQNDAGNLINGQFLKNNGSVGTFSALPQVFNITNEPATLATTTYELSVNFGTGVLKDNILGFPDSRGQIQAGSVTINRSYAGYYRRWIGSNSLFPTSPSSIRTLSLSTTLDTNNTLASQASPIYIDSKFILIAIPNTKTLTTVITEANENLTSQFSVSSVQIPDAGSTLRDYKLYYLETAVPLNANLTNVTIS